MEWTLPFYDVSLATVLWLCKTKKISLVLTQNCAKIKPNCLLFPGFPIPFFYLNFISNVLHIYKQRHILKGMVKALKDTAQ